MRRTLKLLPCAIGALTSYKVLSRLVLLKLCPTPFGLIYCALITDSRFILGFAICKYMGYIDLLEFQAVVFLEFIMCYECLGIKLRIRPQVNHFETFSQTHEFVLHSKRTSRDNETTSVSRSKNTFFRSSRPIRSVLIEVYAKFSLKSYTAGASLLEASQVV